MIVSFSPGRIRLRFRELKNTETAEKASARIKNVSGINKVEINPITGSLLVEFDTEILPSEKLLEMGKSELAKLGITIDIPVAQTKRSKNENDSFF